MIATLVPARDWLQWWPRARPLLEPAFSHGRDYAASDAPERLASGVWWLWVVVAPGVVTAAGITEIVEFPQRRKCWVVAYGGDGKALRLLWPMLRQVAQEQRCEVVEFSGRRGWLRSGFLPEGAAHRADLVEVPV